MDGYQYIRSRISMRPTNTMDARARELCGSVRTTYCDRCDQYPHGSSCRCPGLPYDEDDTSINIQEVGGCRSIWTPNCVSTSDNISNGFKKTKQACRTPPFAICALVYYADFFDSANDRTWHATMPLIWTEIMIHVSIITACIPSLKRFLADVQSGLMGATISEQ